MCPEGRISSYNEIFESNNEDKLLLCIHLRVQSVSNR